LQNKKKILIPGGTGFIGYHLCLFFKKKSWIVHSVSKTKPKVNRRVKGVKYIYCNVTDKKNLKKKLDNYYDYIVNLSGYVDHGKGKSIKKVHFEGCKNLVYNFKEKRPKRFIQIGSSIEYGRLNSPQKENLVKKKINTFSFYGNAKLDSTFFLLDLYNRNKFPVTVLRLYLVYGPNQDNNRVIPFVINNSIKNKEFQCSPGYQYRDFTYIDDVTSAINKSLKSNRASGEIINIGYGRPKKMKNLIMLLVKLVGQGKPIFSKIKLRSDELIKLYPNITKAKKLINWVPQISLKRGLYRTIKFYKNNEKS
jgi:nucleoside-diphosphate-sugar epimerase